MRPHLLVSSSHSLLFFLFIASMGMESRASAFSGVISPAPGSFFPVPILAESLTPDQSNWLINAIGAVGVLIWIGVGAMKLYKSLAPQRAETIVAGQPIAAKVTHPFVEQPAFDKHTDEIWKVINGIRADIGHIKTNIASIAAAREANGGRLTELAGEMHQVIQQLNRLAGLVEAHIEKGGRRS